MSKPTTKKRCWSFSAGERGTNRVRAFEHGARGLFLEWFAPVEAGGARKRLRQGLGTDDREIAKAAAEEMASRLRCADVAPTTRAKPAVLTLAQLFDIYGREVTPAKSDTARAHDERARALFLRAFGRNTKPGALSLREWNRYIEDRRSGRLVPPGAEPNTPVRDRVIEQDLRLLLAVLNWATLSRQDGASLLDRNPLKGLTVPKEENPQRAVLSAEQFARVRVAARSIGLWLECFAVLAWETGHRAASIRQLRWSDVDFDSRRIHWRGESDKIEYDHWNPLTDEAFDALKAHRARASAIGDAWIFPADRGEPGPRTCNAMCNLWKRIAAKAGIPKGQRYGWHSCRRGFANELRDVPLRDLKDLGGWKTAQTILTCYQQPNEDAQRAALARRRRRTGTN